MVHIRPARAEDQATINTMVRGAHLNPFDLNGARFLVAEDDSGIVGVGQIRLHPGAPELASLVVRKDRRGNGVGGQLVHALIAPGAQSSGALYLFCRPRLESYYARFGFQPVSVQDAPPSLRTRYAIGRFLTGLLLRRPMVMMVMRRQAASR